MARRACLEVALYLGADQSGKELDGMKTRVFPGWFHRANWAGGALGCLLIGIYPFVRWGDSTPALLWMVLWILLGLGAANNARRGVDSLGSLRRLRRVRRR